MESPNTNENDELTKPRRSLSNSMKKIFSFFKKDKEKKGNSDATELKNKENQKDEKIKPKNTRSNSENFDWQAKPIFKKDSSKISGFGTPLREVSDSKSESPDIVKKESPQNRMKRQKSWSPFAFLSAKKKIEEEDTSTKKAGRMSATREFVDLEETPNKTKARRSLKLSMSNVRSELNEERKQKEPQSSAITFSDNPSEDKEINNGRKFGSVDSEDGLGKESEKKEVEIPQKKTVDEGGSVFSASPSIFSGGKLSKMMGGGANPKASRHSTGKLDKKMTKKVPKAKIIEEEKEVKFDQSGKFSLLKSGNFWGNNEKEEGMEYRHVNARALTPPTLEKSPETLEYTRGEVFAILETHKKKNWSGLVKDRKGAFNKKDVEIISKCCPDYTPLIEVTFFFCTQNTFS